MTNQLYPQWIDEYTRATHHALINMMPASWGPLDVPTLFGSLNGTFLAKVYEAMQRIKEQGCSTKEVAAAFSSPSALRGSIFFSFDGISKVRAKK